MEAYKNLYEKVYDFDNLYNAYLEARENKKYRREILAFTANLEENLIDIQNELIHQTYAIGRYRERYVYEPKKRLIMALPFKDRVVQCAIYRVVNPIFVKSYIKTSYGSIVGGGNINAIKKLHYWLRMLKNKPGKHYALKMDIAKFFFRVPHDVQLRILGKKIKDARLMWLFDSIINSDDTPFGLPLDVVDVENCTRLYDVGMPVGNLVSQMIANVVLNEVDQFIKRELKVKFYMRYMDDMLILSNDKQKLRELWLIVEDFLRDNLRLTLNKKTSIRPVDCGIEFVGFRVWHNDIRLKKQTSLHMKRRLKGIRNLYSKGKIPLEKCRMTLFSYLGFMKHCNSYHLRKKILDDFVLVRGSPEDTTSD